MPADEDFFRSLNNPPAAGAASANFQPGCRQYKYLLDIQRWEEVITSDLEVNNAWMMMDSRFGRLHDSAAVSALLILKQSMGHYREFEYLRMGNTKDLLQKQINILLTTEAKAKGMSAQTVELYQQVLENRDNPDYVVSANATLMQQLKVAMFNNSPYNQGGHGGGRRRNKKRKGKGERSGNGQSN